MSRVFLLGGRGGGGEEVFVQDLADHPPPGVSYDLVLDHHASTPRARALTVREVLFNRLVHPRLWPLMGLRAYAVGQDVDLVHVHNAPTWLRLPRGCPVVYSVGGSGYPHYLETYLGWDEERIAGHYRKAGRTYGRFGIRNEVVASQGITTVVVFSDFAAGQLRRFGVPADKLRVIPPGFHVEPGPPAAESRPDGPCTFLLVGRHPHRKGADVAVEAMALLAAGGVEARLLLVGDEAYPAMGDGGGGQGRIQGRVLGWGPVPRERLFNEFFRAADVVLVPSRAEGFGFTAVEAMGHAKPVIASSRDALPEIVGEGGLLVTPGDASSLARAMAQLASDLPAARAMGDVARRRFEAVYLRSRVRGLWSELYRHVLEWR